MAAGIVFDNGQVFLFLLIALWFYLVSKAYETPNKIFVLGQFAVIIPLTILCAAFSFNYPFGFLVVFILPCISIGIIADIYYKHDNR